jgi:hypothetical protein
MSPTLLSGNGQRQARGGHTFSCILDSTRRAEVGWIEMVDADLAETGERGANSDRVAKGAPRATSTKSKQDSWGGGVPATVD